MKLVALEFNRSLLAEDLQKDIVQKSIMYMNSALFGYKGRMKILKPDRAYMGWTLVWLAIVCLKGGVVVQT